MTLQWNKLDEVPGLGIEYVDFTCRFRMKQTPSRHYDLYNNGTVVLKRTSLQKCKDRAEEIANPTTPIDTDLKDDMQKLLDWKERAVADAVTKFQAPGAMKVLGEIIAWTPGEGGRTVKQVHQALADSNLTFPVKDLLPRYAFSRACKVLEKGRIIEPCPKHDIGDTIAYQFTQKHTMDIGEHQEWYYNTEAILHVNKDTGKVYCKDSTLMAKVQELLDAAVEKKTANDITRMVNQLFKKHADLFPIRDNGFAYFVPKEHLGFVIKVESFLKALGGRMNRFKVADPDGTGSASVKDTIACGLEVLVQEHKDAVKEFGLTTHAATLEAQAKRINETRVKIEAYAYLLDEKKDELLKFVDEVNGDLVKQVKVLAGQKEWATEVSTTVNFAKTTVNFSCNGM